MPVLEYTGGKNPFQDIDSFVEHVRKMRPGISDHGVNVAVKRQLARMIQRQDQLVFYLMGEDILSDHPEGLRAWPYLLPRDQARLMEHPVDRGDRLPPGASKAQRLGMIARPDRRNVHRSALISIPSLANTYVWSKATDWQQDVTGSDREIIMAQPGSARFFIDVDRDGRFVPVRSYSNLVATETFTARDAGDYAALLRQHRRAPHWQGADMKG